MIVERVLLLGGSGFIGSAVAAQLAARGIFVTLPTRREARARHLLLLPTVEVVEADIHDPAQLANLVKGQDAVINLVGILHGDFTRAHVELPRAVAMACVTAGVRRMVQMSALGADVTAPSEYLQSRDRGEEAVANVAAGSGGALRVTVFRPSVVFGEHDRFLNLFASLCRVFPIIALGSPGALFQPVWVEDVARAIVASLALEEAFGKTYPLVGPRIYTLREILAFVLRAGGLRRLVIGLGPGLSMLQAALFEHLPGKLITRDNVRSMMRPNTAETAFPALFGGAQEMELIAAAYLAPAVAQVRLDALRHRAGRSI